MREGQRQRSGRKIADVSDLRTRGVNCELKGKTFCHANIVRKYGSTYGQVTVGDLIALDGLARRYQLWEGFGPP